MKKKYTKKEIAQWKTADEQRKKELSNQIALLGESWYQSPENITEFLEFKSRFYQYSTNNTMLIYIQNPFARFCGSFQKYKEMGYSVKRGEKGLKIFVPTPVTLFRTSEKGEWNKISEATKAEKEKIKNHEYETRRVTYFKIGTVFEISQTNCPLEDYPKILQDVGYSSEQHEKLFKAFSTYLNDVINSPVSIEDIHSVTVKGFFSPAENLIKISDRLNSTEKLSVLTHEAAHAILHNESEIMELQEKNIYKSSAQIELEADTLSIMFQNFVGIDITDSRKHHLATSFRTFAEEQSNLEIEAQVTITDIIDNISDYYNQHIKLLQKYIDNELNDIKSTENIQPNLQPPYVHIISSEHPALPDDSYYNIKDAQNIFLTLDTASAESIKKGESGYFKTNFQIHLANGDKYSGQQDFGNGDGGLINHIDKFWKDELSYSDTSPSAEKLSQSRKLVYTLWNAYDDDYIQVFGNKIQGYKSQDDLQKVVTANEQIIKHLNNKRLRKIEFNETGEARENPLDTTAFNPAVSMDMDGAMEI